MSLTDVVPLTVAGLVTIVAAGTDLWKFKVYNVLTLPALMTGLVVSACLGGLGGLQASFLGAALGFGLLVVFFAMGGVGAGDVKLLTALGAWLGPYLTYQVFVASALAAGIYAVVLLVLQSGLCAAFGRVVLIGHKIATTGPTLRAEDRVETEVCRPDRRRRLVPFAAMTCVGFFATLALWSHQFREVWPPYFAGGSR